MTKKIFISFIAMVMVFSFIGVSFAFEAGNERKGKYLYRSNCRTCHKDGASATPLGPNNKTQAQWERTFEKYERLDCVKEWEKLSESDRNDILTYLHGHAFDSPSPATCD
ncbi:MAG: cytochrome c [Desulfobacteraceae bacterium]|nr:cytochrome c [Desulfobacteraceae bacterium]MBC2754605.1 cytochrome c [Desulfobacteraceae bacterium]